MDKLKSSGFFFTYYQNLRNNLKSEEIKSFSSLTTNEERFKFVHSLNEIEKKLCLQRHDRENVNGDEKEIRFYKDSNCALQMKNVGNKFFGAQQWNEALNFYNKSYLMTPVKCVNDIAIIFANRSAVLYHLQNYDLALREIDRATAANYPKELIYKLKERKAKCWLAKKNNKEALKAFQETVQSLDDSKLPHDKHFKMERDAQVMIKIIIKNMDLESKMKRKPVVSAAAEKPKTKETNHFISDSLAFDYNEEEGRFAKANKDIVLGANLVQEKPHVSCLLKEYSQTHCQHCFKRSTIPIACNSCADVIFCSEKCRDVAMNSYHKYECGILGHLWNSGASITCLMALRVITQKPLQYFNDMRKELEVIKDSKDFSKIDCLPNDDYRRVFGLVTHEKERTFDDIYHRIVMSDFLIYCAKLGGYFNDNTNVETLNYIGYLMYHNIQFMQFNAHEIAELQYQGKDDSGKSVFIGGGLYPTLALFNHSCDPGVVRHYVGNMVVVRSIKKILAGSIVAENYGPIFTQVPKEERQDQLLDQYKFKCMCVPCNDNWPTFKDMNDRILRFRCEGLDNKCKNVLLIPTDINEFMIKCTECGESTNIMKGLKSLQDTDILFKTATRLHETRDYKGALAKYMEMVNLLDLSLAPPFRDFHLAQQGVRRCILETGNKVNL